MRRTPGFVNTPRRCCAHEYPPSCRYASPLIHPTAKGAVAERKTSMPWQRVRQQTLALLLMVSLSVVAAAAPCRALLSPYLEEHDGLTVPCLVDLQEQGVCFDLPQQALATTVRSFDGYVQDRGVTPPAWQPSQLAELTVIEVASGDRLEIVFAADGPFGTHGICRVLPERSASAVR